MASNDSAQIATTYLIAFATFVGPIVAVWASEYRQQKRVLRERKENVFRSLWATRSVPLDIRHVQPLNEIDFAFPEKKNREIAESWKVYQQHLNLEAPTGEALARWTEKGRALLQEIVLLMAKSLSIPFDKSYVKQRSYHPQAHCEIVNLQCPLQIYLFCFLCFR